MIFNRILILCILIWSSHVDAYVQTPIFMIGGMWYGYKHRAISIDSLTEDIGMAVMPSEYIVKHRQVNCVINIPAVLQRSSYNLGVFVECMRHYRTILHAGNSDYGGRLAITGIYLHRRIHKISSDIIVHTGVILNRLYTFGRFNAWYKNSIYALFIFRISLIMNIQPGWNIYMTLHCFHGQLLPRMEIGICYVIKENDIMHCCEFLKAIKSKCVSRSM